MTDSSAENPALPVVSSEPRASEPSGAAARPPTEPKTYRNRFIAVYAVLGLTLVGAIVGAVVLLILQNGPLAAPAWSSWKPASRHHREDDERDRRPRRAPVQAERGRRPARRRRPGAPKVDERHKDVKISAIAVRKTPQSNTGIQVFPSNKTWTVQSSAASAKNCSIACGKATLDARPARAARGARGRALHVQVRAVGRLGRRLHAAAARRRRRRRSSTSEEQPQGTALAAAEQDADAATPPLPTDAETWPRRRRSTG